MADCKIDVISGVCGMNAVIVAKMDDEGNVSFSTETTCPHVKKLVAEVGTIVPWTEIATPINQTKIYIAAGKCIPHAACIVPCSMMKATEAVAGLALKRNISATFE